MFDEKILLTVTHAGMRNCDDMHSWGPGIRDSYIIHYVIRGSGYLMCGDRTHRINAGESFIIYPNAVVCYYPDENDPWEYIWANFSGSQAKRLMERTAFSQDNPVCPKLDCELLPLFRTLVNSYRNPSPADDCLNRGYMYLIAALYIEYFPSPVRHDTEERLFERAAGYIEASLHHPSLTVESVAAQLGISRVTLYRVFMDGAGQSPNKYITEQRMKRACAMLNGSRHSVKSIALSLGFENPLYFSKVFKSNIGATPTQYRNNATSQ